jgi:hypothetical protein
MKRNRRVALNQRSAYLDYAHYYLAARDGMLTDKPDPEFW